MSEFKIPGNAYISQWNGSSANPGTALAPYAHPVDPPSSTTLVNVIGPGYYVIQNNLSKDIRLIADGQVTLDFLGVNSTARLFYQSSFLNPTYQGIYFKNLDILNDNAINGGQNHMRDCIIDVKRINTVANSNGRAFFYNSLLFNSQGIEIASISTVRCQINLFGSIILNSFSSNTLIPQIHLSYIPKNVNFKINLLSSSLSNFTAAQIRADFQDSLINGTIEFIDTIFEFKKLFDGSIRPDANPLFQDIASIGVNWPSIYTFGKCFAGNPKVLDVFNRLVEPDSDLLKVSGIYGFIGGVRPGKSIPVNSNDSDVTITTTNIDTSNPTNWVIQSPETSGTIKILWKLSDNISEIQRLLLDALLSFDGSVAGGTAGNNNVPDIFPTVYTPLSQVGLKPNRLTYALRTSQSISKPVITAEWDNDNVTLGTTVGAFYIQEWNTKPTIVTALGVRYGNGNPESIGGVSNGINARWAEAEIRLTNNRSF